MSLRLGAKVEKVSRNIDGKAWDVEIEGREVITCDKLIVASGLNSKPAWPDIQMDGLRVWRFIRRILACTTKNLQGRRQIELWCTQGANRQ
jgi:glycine/D-amino acid oxidase-like deaminating enzyme